MTTDDINKIIVLELGITAVVIITIIMIPNDGYDSLV